jgi:hypothetical protein
MIDYGAIPSSQEDNLDGRICAFHFEFPKIRDCAFAFSFLGENAESRIEYNHQQAPHHNSMLGCTLLLNNH